MLRTIHVLGEHEIHLEADVLSVGEAIRALDANFPGFIQSIKKEEHYNVCVGSFDEEHTLDTTTIQMRQGEGDIWISPEIIGRKAGVLATVLGAVLVVVGIVLSVYGFGAGAPLIKLGAGLMLSGVAMMLTPVPGTPEYNEREAPDERQSFLFDGPVNTNEQGG